MFFSLNRDHNTQHKLNQVKHVAKVVDNKDPEQSHRVKMRISGIHDEVKDEDLPWTLPTTQPKAQTENQQGNVGPVPPIGSELFVHHEDDSPYHPTYIGGVTRSKTKLTNFQAGEGETYDPDKIDPATGKPQTQPPINNDEEDRKKNYPYVYGDVDRSGNMTSTDTKEDTHQFKHVSGSGYHIDGKGSLAVTVAQKKVGPDAKEVNPAGASFNVYGPCTIHAKGDATVTSEATLILSGKSVEIHSQGDVKIEAKGKLDFGGTELITPPVIKGPDPVGGGRTGSPKDIKPMSEPKSGSRPKEAQDTSSSSSSSSSSASV